MGSRGKGVERRGHTLSIGAQVERRTVGEETTPLRIEAGESEFLAQIAPCFGENPDACTAALPPSQALRSKRTIS
jgi:hypothetical protein